MTILSIQQCQISAFIKNISQISLTLTSLISLRLFSNNYSTSQQGVPVANQIQLKILPSKAIQKIDEFGYNF